MHSPWRSMRLDEQHRLTLLELVIPTLRAMPREKQGALVMRPARTHRRRIRASPFVKRFSSTCSRDHCAATHRDRPRCMPGDAFALLIGAAAHASASSAEAARAAFEAGRERMFPRATQSAAPRRTGLRAARCRVDHPRALVGRSPACRARRCHARHRARREVDRRRARARSRSELSARCAVATASRLRHRFATPGRGFGV